MKKDAIEILIKYLKRRIAIENKNIKQQYELSGCIAQYDRGLMDGLDTALTRAILYSKNQKDKQ